MTLDIALLLAADGVAQAAVYLIIALGLVLVFSVTRVIYVPFGSLSVFAALTLGHLERGEKPVIATMVFALAFLVALVELRTAFRERFSGSSVRRLMSWSLIPMGIAGVCYQLAGLGNIWVYILISIILIVPLGPLIERIVFRPVAEASVLTLLVIALVLDFVLAGLGLLWFGPEGLRASIGFKGVVSLGEVQIPLQSLAAMLISIVLLISFYLLLQKTDWGRVLHAAASNRVGARLVGIRPESTSFVAHLVAALLAAIAGVLIAPIITIYYDSGLMLTLKAFVAAILGGLSSYMVSALGALFVGLAESFISFWNSGLKDPIVFGLLIPILVGRAILGRVEGLDDWEDE